MKTQTQTSTIQFAVATLLALVLGLALAQSVDAQKYAKGTTQASSIQNTKDMCEVSGGTLEVSDGPFEGVKYSKCSGGDMDGYSCAHGQKTFNCSYQIVSPTDGGPVVNPQLEATTKDVQPASGTTFEINPQVKEVQPLEPITISR